MRSVLGRQLVSSRPHPVAFEESACAKTTYCSLDIVMKAMENESDCHLRQVLSYSPVDPYIGHAVDYMIPTHRGRDVTILMNTVHYTIRHYVDCAAAFENF